VLAFYIIRWGQKGSPMYKDSSASSIWNHKTICNNHNKHNNACRGEWRHMQYSIEGQEQFGEQLRQELTIYLGQHWITWIEVIFSIALLSIELKQVPFLSVNPKPVKCDTISFHFDGVTYLKSDFAKASEWKLQPLWQLL
jgi:hypothetical protein